MGSGQGPPPFMLVGADQHLIRQAIHLSGQAHHVVRKIKQQGQGL